MERRLKLWGTLLGLLLLLGSSLQAQIRPPAPRSPELERALAIEEPETRIAALQAFLESHPNAGGNDAVKAGEELVKSWAQLADTQLSEKNLDQGLSYFRKALAVVPARVSDRFFEETVVKIPLAVSVRGYREEALVLAREIEARFSTEAQRLGAVGEFYMSLEAAGDAIRALEAAAQLAPTEPRVHRALGAAYRMGLRLGDAASEYQQAIGLESKEKRTYFELAHLYRAQGAYEEATKLYRKQLELDPKNSPSHKGLALTYFAQGKEDWGLSELNKIGELKGSAQAVTQDNHLQTQLAFYHLARRNLPQARRAAELALTVEPRYSWARLAAAEVDLAEGRHFEAERHLLTALRYANFPSLYFTLGKVYLTVEDFDDALDQFAKAFDYSQSGKFRTRLGGVRERQADGLDELLALERQAAIFVAEPPTSAAQFNLIESLVRLDALLREAKSLSLTRKPGSEGAGDGRAAELEKAALNFIEADGYRRPFRSLYVAQRMAQQGVALELAVQLAQRSLESAEAATEADGSLPDYPNYDREGRLRIFRGRAAEAQGWALLKLGRTKESVEALQTATAAYGELPEGKRARWHLAAAKEASGEEREALDLYIAAYEPPGPEGRTSDVNRTIIELLYRKIHGSLQGLDERIGKPSGVADGKMIAASTLSPPKAQATKGTASVAKAPRGSKPVAGEGRANQAGGKASSHQAASPARALPSPADDRQLTLAPSTTEENHLSLRLAPRVTDSSIGAPPPPERLRLPSIDWDQNISLLLLSPPASLASLDQYADLMGELPVPPKPVAEATASEPKHEGRARVVLKAQDQVRTSQAVNSESPSTPSSASTRPRRILSPRSDATSPELSAHTRKRRVQNSPASPRTNQ